MPRKKQQLGPIQPQRPRYRVTTRTVRAASAWSSSVIDTPFFPFRWNIAHKSNLGSLIQGERAETCDGFLRRLLDCAARVVAAAGDSDLVFVGRSPESLHDLLSGLFLDKTWQGRLTLLQFSVGYTERSVACRRKPESLSAFRGYMENLGLSPAKLVVRERPVAFVDLICNGNTFHQFLLLLHTWAKEDKVDWVAIQRKIKVVAIVSSVKPSAGPKWKPRPQPWVWRDHALWVDELLARGALREVVLDCGVWSYLGDDQDKTTRSYVPEHWGDPSYAIPFREGNRHLRAVRLARFVFEEGQTQMHRQEFTALLSGVREMRHGWLRRLVLELRG